jgi:hypothetical protein
MSETRFYIPCPCHSGSYGTEEANDVFLRPLMEEMKELWQGVDAYESHLKC